MGVLTLDASSSREGEVAGKGSMWPGEAPFPLPGIISLEKAGPSGVSLPQACAFLQPSVISHSTDPGLG